MDEVKPASRRERMVVAGAEALFHWHRDRFGSFERRKGETVRYAGLSWRTRDAYEIGAIRVLQAALREAGAGDLLDAEREDGT